MGPGLCRPAYAQMISFGSTYLRVALPQGNPYVAFNQCDCVCGCVYVPVFVESPFVLPEGPVDLRYGVPPVYQQAPPVHWPAWYRRKLEECGRLLWMSGGDPAPPPMG